MKFIDTGVTIGSVVIGAYSSEAGQRCGLRSLSIGDLDDDTLYGRYRASIRAIYGADLADMNYFGVGDPGWTKRVPSLEHWLMRASRFGSPVLALEPIGPDGFDCFHDGPEMHALRVVLQRVQAAGITVWVRFGSECNISNSPYSVCNNARRVASFRRAARWWRSRMPSPIVFSPLINTAFEATREPFSTQLSTLHAIYEPGVWNRIGGTLYASDEDRVGRVEQMFHWYYSFMRQKDASTPFQLCELGGPVNVPLRRTGMVQFIRDVTGQRWPGFERLNLFAGEVNSDLTRRQGAYGFIQPGSECSYLRDIFWPQPIKV